MDDRGRQVEGEIGVGPYKEGDSLTLECHVPGGKNSMERGGGGREMKSGQLHCVYYSGGRSIVCVCAHIVLGEL